MLEKLTPVVNFINILRATFTNTYPERVKIQLSHSIFLRFWDLRAPKAVCKMLMKLTRDRGKFLNISSVDKQSFAVYDENNFPLATNS